ncbi:MAG: ABC transporter permease [Burkholderiales bacterium]|nr:ABC transporter permease [Burkholderiales bacterium]
MNFMSVTRAVFRKEIIDSLRDKRTMLGVLLSGVVMGPLILIALSGFIASMEEHAERREIYVSGLSHGPSLQNFLERQTWVAREAPTDFEALLRASKLGDPVVLLPSDFESAIERGEAPVVEVVSDSANRQSSSALPRVLQLLSGFNRERSGLTLATRGVSGAVLESMQVQERDLASTQTRAAQLTGMLPFFVMMAVLYGALNAAMDTTAGERERGSLEPLVMNPAHALALVLGKWGAVASVGMLVALLNCLSFLPAQWLLRSDVLQAMFQFGTREVLLFLLLLLPFAAALSALLMAISIVCKSVKEAQASATVLVLGISLLPLMTLMNQSGEAPWHLWVPALAQNTLMTRVIKGEDLTLLQFAVPFLVCVGLTVAGLWFVSHHLRRTAVK